MHNKLLYFDSSWTKILQTSLDNSFLIKHHNLRHNLLYAVALKSVKNFIHQSNNIFRCAGLQLNLGCYFRAPMLTLWYAVCYKPKKSDGLLLSSDNEFN